MSDELNELLKSLTSEVDEICKRFKIESVLRTLLDKNTGKDLPYHNNYHILCVIKNCYEGARYHELSWSSTKTLLLAAMLHDVNHSGGELADTLNIERAVSYIRETYLGFPDYTESVEHIKCTEYPFSKEREPCCIEQKILRDADALQWAMPGSREMLFEGLKAEMQIAQKREIPHKEMLEGQIKFLNNLVFFSQWANQTFYYKKVETRTSYEEELDVLLRRNRSLT